MSETIRLPVELTDVAAAGNHNRAVREGRASLDWSAVERVDDEALAALIAELDLARDADALGIVSMSDAIAELVRPAFEPDWAPRPKSKRPSVRPRGPMLAAPPEPELRRMLEDAVLRDLLGPAGGPDEEIADGTVRDRYLVGTLAPRRVRLDNEQDDRLEVEEGTGSDDGTTDDSTVAAPTMFPSAIGLSFCVAEDANAALRATARWGEYRRAPSETLRTETGRPKTVWKRVPVEQTVTLPPLSEGPIDPIALATTDDGAPRVLLRGLTHRVPQGFVISLFLVNVQDEPEERRDEAWLFQPELAVEAADGGSALFRSRPRHEGGAAEQDEDERALAMLYRDRVELAVGHGVSVHATLSVDDPRRATRIETRVVPAGEVLVTDSPTIADEPKLAELVLDMKVLAEASNGDVADKLRALPDAYREWIARQRVRAKDPGARLSGLEREAEGALGRCEQALSRIEAGIALLAKNEMAAEAFRFANRAMWGQRVHTSYAEARRLGRETTLEEHDLAKNRTWRTFQLAFVLLNLEAITDLRHPERADPTRAVADLLWFPTGGGKTEAYLGLSAYTMGLRRLQGTIAGRSAEHGVAVLMRYTLRLLTLQQFQRATALLCACETIRREALEAGQPRWGTEPFRIGLWVGARSTPNKTEAAAEALRRVRDVKRQQGSAVGGSGSPVQLKSCPWCGSAIDPGKHVKVDPFSGGSGRTLTYCGDRQGACPFSERQAKLEGLPVVVVDEEVYRRTPTLLVATVDKFAQMPWNGATQMLFGRVQSRCERHGFAGAALEDTDHPRRGAQPGTKLREHPPLRPPDLIIQDELHLISGPLGTLVGLYETAVDELCAWEVDGTRVRPKVVASTATIRRARRQVHALFLRDVQVFPPQGIDVGDSFFAKQRDAATLPGRRYLGICAAGRRLKAAIIRVYVAFLSAGQQLYESYGKSADPWMTLVGYFSSLRELAGTRRLVDDDVSQRIRRMDRRGLARRNLRSLKELTSRLGSTEIPELLDLLEVVFDPASESTRREGARHGRRPIDVLLATNMVSVGVDVRRLGLMVVAGQPKNTAEYIQATSRVGRRHPGLVCTIYNWARPRDLSHYETFEHYHQTFYRHVEALSVTPFAPRALDRGLSAVLVSLVRLTEARHAPNDAAAHIDRASPAVRRAIDAIAERAALVEESQSVGDSVRQGLEHRLDVWLSEAMPKIGGAKLGYKAERDGVTRPLLHHAGHDAWQTFTCPDSLRDVEPPVTLVLEDGGLDDEPRPFQGDRS